MKKPRCKHTPCPTDYLAWHAWAEKKQKTHDQRQCPVCGLWAIWKRRPTTPEPETPTDTARRELTEHRTACDPCIAGLDCPTGDDLDRRLTEAASGDLPWPATPTKEPRQ